MSGFFVEFVVKDLLLSVEVLSLRFFWLAASSTDLWIDTQDWGFCGGGTQTGRVAALGVRYQIDPNHLSGIIRSIWALLY